MTIPTSIPHLLAMAHGETCDGPHRCLYCCAPCDGRHLAADHVKSSFTGRNGVAAPGSPYVCAGCTLALREDAEIVMIDGTVRRVPKGCMRAFSWIVTRDRAHAASKAHLDHLRAACLDPPEPPFAIVLSDSGQTHQLYRGVVNHGGEPVVVTLEAERIAYRVADLAGLLPVAARYCAATGKPALAEPVQAHGAMKVIERYRGGEAVVLTWERVWSTPLGRLAAWLCPPRDDCREEYPADVEV